MASQRAFRHLTTSDCLSLDNDPTALLSLKGDWAEDSLLNTSLELSPLQASSPRLSSKPKAAHACHGQHSPLSSLDNLLGSLRADASDSRVVQHADTDAQASCATICVLAAFNLPLQSAFTMLSEWCPRPQRDVAEPQCLLLSCLCSCSSALCFAPASALGVARAHELCAKGCNVC